MASGDSSGVHQDSGLAHDSQKFTIELRKIRVICYDSVESENIKANEQANMKGSAAPAGQFVHGLRSQAIEDFGDDPD